MSEGINTPLRDQFAERIYNAIGGDQADRIMRMFDWAVQDAADLEPAAAREPVAPAGHMHYKGWCNKCLDEGGRIREGDEPVAPASAYTNPYNEAVEGQVRWVRYEYPEAVAAIEAAIRGTTPLDAERLAAAINASGEWPLAQGIDSESARAILVALRGHPSEPA